VSIVFIEFPVVAGETREAFDVLTIFRLRPSHYSTCLMFQGVNAVLVNVKAAKMDFLTSPGTFSPFGFEDILG
jgi:hypothetical protein